MREDIGGARRALVLSSTLAFAGDPVGRYSVVGTNPGNKGQILGNRHGSSAPARRSG